jgi:hypothetical protein
MFAFKSFCAGICLIITCANSGCFNQMIHRTFQFPLILSSNAGDLSLIHCELLCRFSRGPILFPCDNKGAGAALIGFNEGAFFPGFGLRTGGGSTKLFSSTTTTSLASTSRLVHRDSGCATFCGATSKGSLVCTFDDLRCWFLRKTWTYRSLLRNHGFTGAVLRESFLSRRFLGGGLFCWSFLGWRFLD